MRQLLTAALFAVLFLVGGWMHGAGTEAGSSASSGVSVANAQEPPPDRDLPDYDGRGERPTTAAEGALWVPRVIFFPVYVVTEYVIRWPLGAFVTWAERVELPAILVDFFTFEDRKIGIIPTAFFEFDLLPSVGVYVFWDDFLVDDNDLRLHAATWGPDWIRVTVRDRVHLDRSRNMSVSGRFVFERRRDHLFYGLGPRTVAEDASRYERSVVEAGMEFESDLGEWFDFTVGAEFKSVGYADGSCCDDPSLVDEVDRGVFPELPPGFRTGFDVARAYADIAYDSRSGDRPTSASAVRVYTHADYAIEPQDTELSWIRYGGGLGLFLNTGDYRTIGLKFQTAFADALGERQVPFSQQAVVGGRRVTNNVREGRYIGQSMVFATLEYLWPIWVWLDGSLNVAFGNAFGQHLEDFEFDLLRWSAGFGFATPGEPDHGFKLTLGIAGDTFEDGGGFDTFRFFVGANSAF